MAFTEFQNTFNFSEGIKVFKFKILFLESVHLKFQSFVLILNFLYFNKKNVLKIFNRFMNYSKHEKNYSKNLKKTKLEFFNKINCL